MSCEFTHEELAAYRRDGYLLVPSLLNSAEVVRVLEFARADAGLKQDSYGRKDATGRPVRLALWNTPGDDMYGRVSRLPRIVKRMEQLLGGEVYHWHAKMILKEPRVGGAWEWHQDYGYWYHNACMWPLLASCSIALDAATKENGCLQVLRGSHELGRIDHGNTGEQTGADPKRVEQALKMFPTDCIEAVPGDALFFHCNLLHRSDQNTSDHPRWSLICCYNARRNSPYEETRHPKYQPLALATENALVEV